MATEFKRAWNGNERGGIAALEKEIESLKSDVKFLGLGDISIIEQLLSHDPKREVVTVTADDCHPIETLRSILITRSEVFKSEICYYNRHKKIKIHLKTTMHPDSFRAFMHFLYNAELRPGVLPDHAADLMRAADYYKIPILMRKCEDFMVRTATPENAVDLLEVGCKCESEAIIAAAGEQIRRNRGITESDKFKALEVTLPKAAFRVIKYMYDIPEPSEKVAQSSVPAGSDPSFHYDLPFSSPTTDWYSQMQPCDHSIRFNTVTSQPSIVDMFPSLSTLDTNPKVLK